MRNILLLWAALLLWNQGPAFGQQYVISTIVGTGTRGFSGDGGPATNAQLNNPTGVAVDAGGNIYVADYWNNRVRKISQNGIITTVAGTGTPGYSGDGGPADKAMLWGPLAVAVDVSGNLYIADDSNHCVRKVDANDTIRTVAGICASRGYSGDGGPAISAQLAVPKGVAVDLGGNLYISDTVNKAIRKVTSDGIISSVAFLNRPFGVTVDLAGNLYVADPSLYHNAVKKIPPGGASETYAGTGWGGYSSSIALAITVSLGQPTGVAVDSGGSVYIADFASIRKVSWNRIISTIAGNGARGYSGDGGPAIQAMLNKPFGLCMGDNGDVFIADSGNNAIRLLRPDYSTAPSIGAVTSAASNVPGAISPGEILVLYGSGIGPKYLARARVNGQGLITTQLPSTSIVLNGYPAPLLYATATQVGAAVPYEVSGSNVQVAAHFHDQTSAVTTLELVDSAPGLFTFDSSGSGQAAALNQDGSINSSERPALPGSVIVLFATGEGRTSPPGVTGLLASEAPPRPILPVSVAIGGEPAQILYAGGAPGQIAGLMQINARIPNGAVPGDVPVIVQVGGASSQPGVTIAVSEGE